MKETISGKNEGLKKMPSVEQMNNLIFKIIYLTVNFQKISTVVQHNQQSNSLLQSWLATTNESSVCVCVCACVPAGRVSEQIIQPLKRLHSEEVHPELMGVSQTLPSIHNKKSIFAFRPSSDTHKHADLYTKENAGHKTKLMLGML